MAAIGKNVIENLTTAMYENAYTVYREYIQNSADSIDKAVAEGLITKENANINIEINYNKREITIYDNAKGISKDKFIKILTDIADSEKDPSKDKGFRGIGRLAGLGYCDTLIFRSSAFGEDIESVIEWDGVALRTVLADTNAHPEAAELVDQITTIYTNKVKEEEHYFEVVMKRVIPEADDLLNEHEVIKYLSFVAPVPFATRFIFKSKIDDFCKEKNLKIDEYTILVNANPILKPYGTKIYDGSVDNKKVVDEIKDLEFREFKANDGRLLAWMWFGISNFEQQIKPMNEMRGIRLRKENIQIGDENTLGKSPKFFKEPRGNAYFIGEVYAVDSQLIPNARRDDFKRNATAKEFEDEIHKVFYDELYRLYHYANQVKKAFQSQTEYQKKQDEYERKVSEAGFVDDKERSKAEKELESAKEKAEKSARTIELREQDAKGSETLKRVFTGIKSSYKPEKEKKDPEKQLDRSREGKAKEEKKYLTQQLSKYSKKEQKLITKIYVIIKRILPRELADMVVAKIQEELSK